MNPLTVSHNHRRRQSNPRGLQFHSPNTSQFRRRGTPQIASGGYQAAQPVYGGNQNFGNLRRERQYGAAPGYPNFTNSTPAQNVNNSQGSQGTRSLVISPVEARFNSSNTVHTRSSPYVIAKVGNERQRGAVCPEGGLTPSWVQESLLFNIKPTDKHLDVYCYSKNDYESDEYIGHSKVIIDDLFKRGQGDQWFPLNRYLEDGGSVRLKWAAFNDNAARNDSAYNSFGGVNSLPPGGHALYNPAKGPGSFNQSRAAFQDSRPGANVRGKLPIWSDQDEDEANGNHGRRQIFSDGTDGGYQNWVDQNGVPQNQTPGYKPPNSQSLVDPANPGYNPYMANSDPIYNRPGAPQYIPPGAPGSNLAQSEVLNNNPQGLVPIYPAGQEDDYYDYNNNSGVPSYPSPGNSAPHFPGGSGSNARIPPNPNYQPAPAPSNYRPPANNQNYQPPQNNQGPLPAESNWPQNGTLTVKNKQFHEDGLHIHHHHYHFYPYLPNRKELDNTESNAINKFGSPRSSVTGRTLPRSSYRPSHRSSHQSRPSPVAPRPSGVGTSSPTFNPGYSGFR